MAYPDDAFTAERARPEVRAYIRRQFRTLASKTGARTIVEKTCANSLRVGFVDRILPEAQFVFILRDGRDAVASAVSRWRASMDWPYTLKKLRYVPISDVPYYAAQFISNRTSRLVNKERRLSQWGPRIPRFQLEARRYSLGALCALQWRECVERATEQLAALANSKVHSLRYEELVRSPGDVLTKLFTFLGDRDAAETIDYSHVSPSSIGRGREQLTGREASDAIRILAPTLAKFDYA